MKHFFPLAFLGLLSLPATAQEVTVTVHNPTSQQRFEVVEIPLASLPKTLSADSGLVVRNIAGQELTSQVTHDGLLLVHASVRPHSTARYTVKQGTPHPVRWTTTGALYPLRKDDIAWENDRCAYRVYGPALQRTGERSFGTDIWTKCTPDTVVSTRYRLDREGTSFHLDHGNGLDAYRVGATLGLGAPALLAGDSLVMPYCYRDYEILDNGPLRFTVSLTYHPTRVGGNKQVVEHRLISLDEGSHFNRMTVWYDGLEQPTDFATGVPIHEEDTTSYVLAPDFVAYADPTDAVERNQCQLYVATLFPEGITETLLQPFREPHDGATAHVLGRLAKLQNHQRYTYYFGAAWSQSDVATMDEWLLRIRTFLGERNAPLVVGLEKP